MSTELRVYGNEITRMIPSFVKDETKVPQHVLSQDIEFNALSNAKDFEQEFKCKFEILVSENSKYAKAKQALPSKAAILVE